MRTCLLPRALLPVVLSSLFAAPVLASGCQTAPASLRQFLSQGGWGAPDSYVASLHDLNGDGTQEAVVLLTGTDWCGSGGCTLLVAQHRGATWQLISKITLVHPPVVALDRKRSGWQSLSVTVRWGRRDHTSGHLGFPARSLPIQPNHVTYFASLNPFLRRAAHQRPAVSELRCTA